MTTRVAYQKELEALNKDVIEMGTILGRSIDKTVKALETMNDDLAREIIAQDDEIDTIETTIETNCINIIAKQAPIATDLRKISSYMRIISDIERIADHCADISDYIIQLSKEKSIPAPKYVLEMFAEMKSMVSATIDAFIHSDIQKADWVIAQDDKVDEYFKEIKSELAIAMKHNVDRIRQYVDYLMIIKYVERMSDHCTNIAKWIKYIATGNLEL